MVEILMVEINISNGSIYMWQQWVNAILGLWVIAVPFIGLTADALTWTLAITGIAIAVLAFWGVQETSEADEVFTASRRFQHQ